MTARESLNRQTQEKGSSWSWLWSETEGCRCAATACTADKEFALVLRIEIYQHITRHETRLHTLCTRQACFLVACENALQGAMAEGAVGKNCHFHSTTYTIISAESGSTSTHPLAIDVCLNGILEEVEVNIVVLFADHIHVTLQNNSWAVFHARTSWFADKNITRFIYKGLKALFHAKLAKEFYHFFFVFGRTWNSVDACEHVEHAGWFQFCCIHSCIVMDIKLVKKQRFSCLGTRLVLSLHRFNGTNIDKSPQI